MIVSLFEALFENSFVESLLGGDTESRGPQSRFQRVKRLQIDTDPIIIDGSTIPESGVLRYHLYGPYWELVRLESL